MAAPAPAQSQSRRSSATGVILESHLQITRLNTHVTRSGRVFAVCVTLTVVMVIVGLVLKYFSNDSETRIDLSPSDIAFISSGVSGGAAIGSGGVHVCVKRKVTYLSTLPGSTENTHVAPFVPAIVTDFPPSKSPQVTPGNHPTSGANDPLFTPTRNYRRIEDDTV